MKIFGRSGGYWLFWTSTIYFLVAMFDLFVYNFTSTEYIQVTWILVLSLPLWIKPFAKWLNMKTIWEI
ncbi:hypothetical protein UFOVP71_265 [uncultured Caudovirales phage]|uniref:Uncharacterized protein n=1 Tax=uncultured Caudovirales phage TaxID=2100421 RepID=A0A6J5TCU1_9CAUD|nr:hypothetical protein UFOVP71_265 [uncultured Caudovirales phage]